MPHDGGPPPESGPFSEPKPSGKHHDLNLTKTYLPVWPKLCSPATAKDLPHQDNQIKTEKKPYSSHTAFRHRFTQIWCMLGKSWKALPPISFSISPTSMAVRSASISIGDAFTGLPERVLCPKRGQHDFGILTLYMQKKVVLCHLPYFETFPNILGAQSSTLHTSKATAAALGVFAPTLTEASLVGRFL